MFAGGQAGGEGFGSQVEDFEKVGHQEVHFASVGHCWRLAFHVGAAHCLEGRTGCP